ncbi:MAG: hypothetical protein ACKORL_01240 [Phycisphaerales bacterium]
MATHEIQGTLWDETGTASCVMDATHAPARTERDEPRAGALNHVIADALRAAYFAEAGELATRYSVSSSAVVEHLESAGLARMPRPERAISHIRCAVHAAALVRGDAQAWADLLTALGPAFDRACAARLDKARGIAFARRFWQDARASTLGMTARPSGRPRGVRAPDLRTFAATKPLRHWLAERLLGSLETELGRAASAAERLDAVQEVRTLRLPAHGYVSAEATAT